MRSINPIPNHLLIDSIVYKPLISNDGWNDEFGEERTIDNVRVVPTSSLNRTANSEGKQANDTVFIDYVNSSYFPEDAKVGDRINDREVIRVKVLKAFAEHPHHLEIEVI